MGSQAGICTYLYEGGCARTILTIHILPTLRSDSFEKSLCIVFLNTFIRLLIYFERFIFGGLIISTTVPVSAAADYNCNNYAASKDIFYDVWWQKTFSNSRYTCEVNVRLARVISAVQYRFYLFKIIVFFFLLLIEEQPQLKCVTRVQSMSIEI